MTDTQPNIVKHLHVPVSVDHASASFTVEIAEWWPIEGETVSGTGAVMELSERGMFETAADGTVIAWGTITTWEEPFHIHATWYPGGEPEPCTEFDIRFVVAGDGTDVELTHSEWSRVGVDQEEYDGYVSGWDAVLQRFAEFLV